MTPAEAKQKYEGACKESLQAEIAHLETETNRQVALKRAEEAKQRLNDAARALVHARNECAALLIQDLLPMFIAEQGLSVGDIVAVNGNSVGVIGMDAGCKKPEKPQELKVTPDTLFVFKIKEELREDQLVPLSDRIKQQLKDYPGARTIVLDKGAELDTYGDTAEGLEKLSKALGPRLIAELYIWRAFLG